MPTDKDYVNFGDVARDLCGQQSQYASRYINPAFKDEYTQFTGLRIIGNPDDYYSLKIHRDDVESFVVQYFAATKNPTLPISIMVRWWLEENCAD